MQKVESHAISRDESLRAIRNGEFNPLKIRRLRGWLWCLWVCLAIGLVCGGCSPLKYVGLGSPGGKLGKKRYAYRVKRGDTLWSISRRTGVGVKELARTNRLRDPDRLEVGQRLWIPRSMQRISKAAPSGEKAVRKASPKPVNGKPASRRPAQAANRPSPGSKAKFIWPVQGRCKIVSHFGARDDGLQRGIDLAATEGAPVVAVRDGVVTNAFSENDHIGKILGYGNLIFLSHDNGLITLYGYNRRNLVGVGDKVKQGQKIAEVGNTGRARNKAGYRLHFEVRDKYNEKKVYDPEQCLPPLR